MLLVLSAMPEEMEALRTRLDGTVAAAVAGREVLRGGLAGTPIALAFSRWGPYP